MTQVTENLDSANEAIWKARFGDTVKEAENAEKILKKAEKAEYLKGVNYAMLNIAACNFLQSKNDKALKYLSESIKWFEDNRHETGYVRALLLKGNIFESFGDYEKTLLLWLDAYKISLEINDRESEGESCSQLGLIYSRLGNYPKSLEFFNNGLKIREEIGDENGAASSLNRIGMVLRQMKNYEESLSYYLRSLEIRRKNLQTGAIPWTLLGIASTYEEMGTFKESLDYYEQGLKGGDRRCMMQCMLGAGRVLSRLGNAEEAEEKIEGSLLIAQELKSLALIADAYSALAAHYELSGKPEKALENFKQFLKTRDSLQSSEVQNKISNIEIAHAIEKSEQEKEIYRLRHIELKAAYDIIEENNREITASINYASRIQRAILPRKEEIEALFRNIFILYLPRDIVSGDFYWCSEVEDKQIIVAADCTGHGVPGALMSMLGVSFLEEIIKSRKLTESGLILNELRNEIQRALHQTGSREEAKDGMDISLCVIDRKTNTFQYSGAYNSLYMVRKGALEEYHADRMPIGIYDLGDKNFVTQEINYSPGDTIYMYSDGFADQFGGPNRKKFKAVSLKELLVKIQPEPINVQKEILEKEFQNWKGSNSQTDDVLVIGLRL